MLNVRSLWSRPRHLEERKDVPCTGPRFRPRLEAFEDRTVPAHLLPTDLLTITDIDLSDLEVVDGVLTAAEGTVEGTLAGLPFTTDISNFALQLVSDDPDTTPVECSVLNLEVGPIDLDLLGLNVNTSAICLEVTASEGEGLLGDLLCGLAGGLPEIPVLGGVGGLYDVVGDILDEALTAGMNSAGDPPAGAPDICDGECEVLDLALGPVDLSLLGLNVSLDNCEDGPVQVCVSASAGEGLLGDLLCGLSGRGRGLNLDLNEITQITSLASDLFDDGAIAGRDIGQLTSLVNRLKK
jgi:hypothetical protein